MLRHYLFIVTVFISLGDFIESASFTSLEARKNLHEGTDEPWIGSHSLNYTPNPFMRRSRAKTDTPLADNISASSTVSDTAESSLSSSTLQMSSTTTSSPSSTRGRRRKGKKKVKAKGQNRLLPLNRGRSIKKRVRIGRGRNASLTTTAKSRVKIQVLQKAEESVNENRNMTTLFDNNFGGNIELIPIDQVSTNPTFTRPRTLALSDESSFPSTLPAPIPFPMITTPEPIKLDYMNWNHRDNQIPIDFAAAHPEKLNPSFFRNIILKAMMDKLVGFGVATHSPAVFRVPS